VKIEPFLLEIPKLVGTGLTELIAATKPAELHVERGGLRGGARRSTITCRRRSTKRSISRRGWVAMRAFSPGARAWYRR
jgi:hypothetical protein